MQSRSSWSMEKTPPDLFIATEKVCFVVVKAREFDVKVDPVEPDPGSDAIDDGEGEILQDYADDPTLAELRSAIAELNEDEIIDLARHQDFEIVRCEELSFETQAIMFWRQAS